MNTEKLVPNSFLNSIFYRAIRQMYFLSQLFGMVNFSYSPTTGIFLKPINVAVMILFGIILWCLSWILMTNDLTVGESGYKRILLYIGIHFTTYNNCIFVWCISMCIFIFRSNLCGLIEDMIKLETIVSMLYSYRFFFWCLRDFFF